MKRLVISVLLLCFSFGFCIFTNFYLNSKTRELDSILSLCYDYIKNEDEEKAQGAIIKAKNFWQKNDGKFKILLEGTFCETVENCLDNLNFCFYEREYTEAKNSINECRNTLCQIMENERLSIEVIL